MPDVYATIAEADISVVEVLAEVLELRAGDPQQQEIRDAYLSKVEFPPDARVLEVGCGPGPVARALAVRPGVGEVVGVHPSPRFLELARERVGDIANLTFVEGDARALPVDDGSFDVVVFHTTLCHVPGPEDALDEAFRVLRPGGWLAVFDGDYVTTTCANHDHDPLQTCLDAAVAFLVHDRWIVRRLVQLVHEARFEGVMLRSHGYLEAPSAGYMLALIDRGADTLRDTGRIGAETADALKAEARRRSDAHEFFGHIAYASAIARKPASEEPTP